MVPHASSCPLAFNTEPCTGEAAAKRHQSQQLPAAIILTPPFLLSESWAILLSKTHHLYRTAKTSEDKPIILLLFKKYIPKGMETTAFQGTQWMARNRKFRRSYSLSLF